MRMTLLGSWMMMWLAVTMVSAGEPKSPIADEGQAAVPATPSEHLDAASSHGTTAAAKHDKHPHNSHDVSVYVFDAEGQLVGPVDSPKVVLTASQWRRKLSDEQYHTLRTKIPKPPSAVP